MNVLDQTGNSRKGRSEPATNEASEDRKKTIQQSASIQYTSLVASFTALMEDDDEGRKEEMIQATIASKTQAVRREP